MFFCRSASPTQFQLRMGGQPCPKGIRVHAGMVKAARPCCLAALRCEAARSPACCTCNVSAGPSQPSAMAMQLHGICALASASSNHATPSGEAPDSIQDGPKDRSFSLINLLAPCSEQHAAVQITGSADEDGCGIMAWWEQQEVSVGDADMEEQS